MTAHKFTKTEIHYLKMLPAVSNVTSTRITYSDEFRKEATRRYLAGESPVEIFRDAGLDPKLIGHKRIERAFARWKAGRSIEHVRRGTGVFINADPVVFSGEEAEDAKDRLIASQALKIAQLEQRIKELTQSIKDMSVDDPEQ